MPAISVLMPVYNTPVPFLREAVQSILNQTFQDFEFLIMDDGSTGETRQYLEQLSDPRIRLLRNERNLGITKSLNIGLRAAQGRYIARMDGDDVSYPERFEKQLAFMQSNPDVIVCGARVLTSKNERTNLDVCFESREQYLVRMLFTNPGPSHPTAFIDREVLRAHAIEYDEKLIYAQDYGLWVSLIPYGRICILPEILLFYRRSENQVTVKHKEKRRQCVGRIQKKLLCQLLDDVTDEEADFHYVHSAGHYPDATMTPEVAKWYKRLLTANRERGLYDQSCMKAVIEIIKKRLLLQTFGQNAPKWKLAIASFRYLSVRTIALYIIHRLFPSGSHGGNPAQEETNQ